MRTYRGFWCLPLPGSMQPHDVRRYYGIDCLCCALCCCDAAVLMPRSRAQLEAARNEGSFATQGRMAQLRSRATAMSVALLWFQRQNQRGQSRQRADCGACANCRSTCRRLCMCMTCRHSHCLFLQDQLAQKHAAVLGNIGRALAAGWFQWWRSWLEKRKTAEAMAKKYANRALTSQVSLESFHLSPYAGE